MVGAVAGQEKKTLDEERDPDPSPADTTDQLPFIRKRHAEAKQMTPRATGAAVTAGHRSGITVGQLEGVKEVGRGPAQNSKLPKHPR